MTKESYSIVLVDDDPDDHFLFQEALNKIGVKYTLTSVYTGVELFDYLLGKGSYNNIGKPKPDLIISDMFLPLLNGLEILKTIKSFKNIKKIPFYFLSTIIPTLDVENIIKLGARGAYQKPYTNEKLREIISEILVGI